MFLNKYLVLNRTTIFNLFFQSRIVRGISGVTASSTLNTRRPRLGKLHHNTELIISNNSSPESEKGKYKFIFFNDRRLIKTKTTFKMI